MGGKFLELHVGTKALSRLSFKMVVVVWARVCLFFTLGKKLFVLLQDT